MQRSEPHKIMVKVWHNAKYHYIHYSAETSYILRRLYKDPVSNAFMNPTEAEWKELVKHRDVQEE